MKKILGIVSSSSEDTCLSFRAVSLFFGQLWNSTQVTVCSHIFHSKGSFDVFVSILKQENFFFNLLIDMKPFLTIHFKHALQNIMATCNAFADGTRFPCQTNKDLIVFFSIT